MIHLLDTSTCSALMRREPLPRSRLQSLGATDEVVLCVMTRGEILHGIERLPPGRRRAALERDAAELFAEVRCVPIEEAAADAYARLKQDTTRRGAQLDENDLWIAATAVILKAVLVAADADFRRVQGLPVENWSH